MGAPGFIIVPTPADRSIGGIIPNVVIEEQERDELVVTDHPVEFGSTISDHAFDKPEECTLRWAWSNSSLEADGNDQYAVDIYAQLIALKKSRTPIEVFTGKRAYSSMVIQSVLQETRLGTEFVAMITAKCRQIIVVSTQLSQLNPNLMEDSSVNGPVVTSGTKQVAPAPTANTDDIAQSASTDPQFQQDTSNFGPNSNALQDPTNPAFMDNNSVFSVPTLVQGR